ncbi:FAD dependent oxidoreductase [Cunninghamella echinulata]|nr:FAD dependent oxidoreductase [Cunninghamella echinulata]
MPKVIIVGGGCFGLSTAYALSLKEEYEVFVFDKEAIPASDAASTDINKIVRYDYGDDVLYMKLMMEALPLWHQLNKERLEEGEEPVFHQTGVLMMSQNGSYSNFERKSLRAIREAGYDHAIEELLTPESIIQRFPQFENAVKNGYNIAYLNKQGGWCNSAEAVKHLYKKCLKQGVQFITGNEGAFLSLIYSKKDNITVEGIMTQDGRSHLADKVVIAAGAWTPSLIDCGGLLTATGQTVVHFQPTGRLLESFQKNTPVWCGDLSNTGCYGFPVNKDGKMKIGIHNSGCIWPCENKKVSVPRTQTSHQGDTIPLSGLQQMRKFLGAFLPETSALDITYSRLCWYCDSIDGDFLISYHPKYPNLIVASGCSGHGMKFIPNIGFQIRNVLEGISTDYTRAWAWRELDKSEIKLDGLRNGANKVCGIINGDEATRLVSLDELKAARASL